ncbi:MAG: hypothetical protein ACXW34_07030 [Nitrospira sp.]
MSTKLEVASQEAGKTAEFVGAALGLAAEDLRKGYEHLGNRL